MSIPNEWLIPQRLSNGWKFQCCMNFREFVSTNLCGIYFGQMLRIIENDLTLVNFHLKIQCHRQKNNQFDIFIFHGDDQIDKDAEPVTICSSCDINHEMSRTTLLSETRFTCGWLDFRLRPKLIITPKRHVERLAELDCENGEMSSFWFDAVQLIDDECCLDKSASFPVLSLNQGTFRKHAHLHLKIDVDDASWNNVIVNRHRERIDRLRQLLKNVDLVRDCFSEQQLKKELEKGVLGVRN